MNQTIQLTVNGQSRTVSTDPQRSLLDVLREEFHLTGAKYGCGDGQCRACTVLINDRAVVSCTMAVADAEGQRIQTIEGLADGDRLHPVQEAFLAENAFQCGYCTSGMILGTVALLREIPNPTDGDILARMNRHLCRCCSYVNYMNAFRRAAAESSKGRP